MEEGVDRWALPVGDPERGERDAGRPSKEGEHGRNGPTAQGRKKKKTKKRKKKKGFPGI